MRYRVIASSLPFALSLAGLLATPVVAQDSQDSSVAEAARRAQEQKKSAPKSPKVITNDNLPGAPKPDAPASARTQPAPPQPVRYCFDGNTACAVTAREPPGSTSCNVYADRRGCRSSGHRCRESRS